MTLQALVPLITYADAPVAGLGPQIANAAQYLGADIHVLVLEPDFRTPTSALGRLVIDVPGMLKGIKDSCHVRGQDMSKAILDAASHANVGVRAGRVEAIPERFGDVAADQAHYHDLTMFGWSRDNQVVRGAIEAVIFGSGRPVLVLPERQDPPDFATVVVAWDGSRVAARAVADAERFLTRATRVIVATVTDEKRIEDPQAAERLVEHLTRRGISAEARTVASNGRPIGQTLQDEALADKAGLLVLGGYGHTRLRDFVLGGATKAVLDDLRVPVLLSH
jgi:nucleotide-binding universal stress UspA family protein